MCKLARSTLFVLATKTVPKRPVSAEMLASINAAIGSGLSSVSILEANHHSAHYGALAGDELSRLRLTACVHETACR